MNNQKSIDFSAQLKDIAKDLSFLASPRYPLHDLKLLFPEHLSFINQLEDTSLPFSIDIGRKKKAIDEFLELLQKSDLFTGFRDLFQNRALDYMTIASMIENFGSSTFYQGCVGLYGSSRGKNDEIFFRFLSELPKTFEPDRSTKSLDEEEARSYLRDKLLETFPQSEFDVKASSSLLSDSSAGRRVLKLNPHKMHSTAQLDIFLVHEGWVHLGTSINGSHQKDNPWLSSWAPRTTRLQEGLAILTEMITNNMTLERWLKVRLRHQAVIMAEQGADISLVYEFLLDHQLEKADAFKLSLRVFRGVPLEGGMAFTKELLYLDGLVDLLLHLKKLNLELSSLWYGKMSFEEHRFLNEHKNTLKPTVTYFPRRLSDKDVTLKLDFLKNLVGIFFKDDSH